MLFSAVVILASFLWPTSAMERCPSGTPAFIECVKNPFVPGTYVCPGASEMSCPDLNGKHYCCPEKKPPAIVSRPSLPDFLLPRSTCFDAAANCFDHIRQCNSPGHVQIMKKTCAKTCAFCSGMMRDEPECVDTTDKCGEWQKKGFCEMEDVDVDEKKLYCAKTCGLC
ncbi:hypothetical protein QR680_013959 [Steinernema hermaphroditum]|uniref:ShKT domain-containing protein n=1 Tax=Steinernema hermaphroditum TaxID=289476 RepID=A0AA39I9V0_9BILA|nr:hypothetical protein QR680_013959 [Steinernema hermaphroditum]